MVAVDRGPVQQGGEMTSLAPFAVGRRDAWQEGSGRRRQEPQGSQGGLALT